MSSAIAVPILKTSDDSLNQVQQNLNKVFRNLSIQVVELQKTASRLSGLGDVIFSSLNLSQVQAVHGKGFIAANGQSCVGSEYAAFSGFNTVPNISVSGASAYIKVNNA